MERQELINEFKNILKDHVSEDEMPLLEDFDEQIKLKEDLAIDSLDVINIVIDIENHFSITINDEALKTLSDVGSCLDLIEESLQSLAKSE